MGHAQVKPPPHHPCSVCKLMKQPLTNFATHYCNSFADQSTSMTNEQRSLVTAGGLQKACSCASCCVLYAAWSLPWFGFASRLGVPDHTSMYVLDAASES